ncbi:3-phenylpropionate MFS transporter [Moritella viscosa]|uniref:Probable 3-phenylpropionic acid transporter n=1 Tax=Moritella viscosa TaxID=80854 RepID=A0A1K9YJC8_9GAMM|nr:3-phenylpropionate MFS transporter [Moritella viscosa]SGY81718.1 Probable 3-phenylpropionic acid transporter [Moritella viscosa]SHN96031.1 Probable 3-phenylpropionic acid transporter [Moritella viscosa]SHN96041.1 Probable 3-phenylpropionic acid transporter [Moritella viscosa]SHN96129.1 Probable 3-phenylpropionic acid transporter [Moritella viscosa]SHN96275.1 Probable 3-phenylpropionic acid transporter [Moritella viscosa]
MSYSLPSTLWMGLYYLGFFGVYGVLLPFWALWLKGEGTSTEMIGTMLAFALLARSAGALLLTRNLATTVSLLQAMRRLTLTSIITFAGFYLSNNVYVIFLLVVITNFVFSPLMALGEAMAAKLVRYNNMDYGKTRLWGSIGFMLASALTGVLVESFDHQIILFTIIVGLAALLLLTVTPVRNLPQDTAASSKRSLSFIAILSRPSFWPFLLITALLQGAHAAYYGFGAVYWQDIGISETYIGYFWSMGVVGEIFFLAIGRRLFANTSMATMFVIATLGSIVRWLTLSYAVDVTVIMLSQLLHGVTFGIAHLAAMRYISENVADEDTMTVQAIYAAIPFSLAIALLTFLSGLFYPGLKENIFILMAIAVLPVLLLVRSKHI